jgi:hypothetical protein
MEYGTSVSNIEPAALISAPDSTWCDAEVVARRDKGQRQGYIRNVESPRIIALAILGMDSWAHRWFR